MLSLLILSESSDKGPWSAFANSLLFHSRAESDSSLGSQIICALKKEEEG